MKVEFNQSKESIENAFSDLLQGSPTSTIPSSYKTHGIGIGSFPQPGTKPGQIPFSLNLPVHDLNDVFFANFVHAIYKDTDQSGVFIRVREQYFGIPGNKFAEGLVFNGGNGGRVGTNGEPIDDDILFSRQTIDKLICVARELLSEGIQYALVTVFENQQKISSPPRPGELSPYDGHVENIDLRQLTSLNMKTLADAQPNTTWTIGDTNYAEEGVPGCVILYKAKADQFGIIGGRPAVGLAIYQPN